MPAGAAPRLFQDESLNLIGDLPVPVRVRIEAVNICSRRSSRMSMIPDALRRGALMITGKLRDWGMVILRPRKSVPVRV
jgi:hypothetical protein